MTPRRETPTGLVKDKVAERIYFDAGMFGPLDHAQRIADAVRKLVVAEAIESIRASWDDQCAGNRNEDACESCRAYADAIRSLGGEP